MPRLPDRDSLGARPVPQARRSVTSARTSGQLAAAGAQIGGQVMAMGQQMIEKEDKLAYSAAKAKLLQADLQARTELQDDPDFETFEQRYNERMGKVRGEVSGLIKSRSDRALFEVDSETDLVRGRSNVAELARGKRISHGLAELDQAEFNLSDSALNAADEDGTSAALQTYSDMIDGAASKGILDPQDVVKRKRGFAAKYNVAAIDRDLTNEQPDKARERFEKVRHMLDSDIEAKIEGQIVGAEQGRTALTDADRAVKAFLSMPVPDPPVALPDGKAIPRQTGTGWAKVATDVAAATGLSPTDVAAVMSYETGGSFSPTIMGGKNGQYMGLIQFGPSERKKYGITPTSSQDDWSRAIIGFMRDRGFKKGMGVLDFYSTINAGSPGRYNASDGNGTVRTHTEKIINDHRGNAKRWLAKGGVVAGDESAPLEPAARTYDAAKVYGNVDALAKAEGWTPERKARALREVDKVIGRDEGLKAREENDAADQALETVIGLGEKFTSMSQLPPSVVRKLSPSARESLMNRAERNAAPKEAKSNGPVAVELKLMALENPEGFAKVPLAEIAGQVTPAELADLMTKRAEIQKGDPSALNIDSEISSTIERRAPLAYGIDFKKNPAAKLQIADSMRKRLIAATGGKKKPTDADYRDAFDYATSIVTVKATGEKRLNFAVTEKDGVLQTHMRVRIPAIDFKKARDTLTRNMGREPTEQQIIDFYHRMRGNK